LGGKYKKYVELCAEHKYETLKDGSADIDEDHNMLSTDPELNKIYKLKETQTDIFKQLGINDRYCCKRHMVSHIDLIKKI
tara:strand:+ start:7377 stop:7616 length:240 start_codon:yes stop_codon:yes gene_type:complete